MINVNFLGMMRTLNSSCIMVKVFRDFFRVFDAALLIKGKNVVSVIDYLLKRIVRHSNTLKNVLQSHRIVTHQIETKF
jgi:hypothetical protein